MQAQSTHASPRRGLQTASEMARPVRLALRVLELYQGTRRWDASSVSQVFPLRPRKGPGRRRPRLNSPTPSRQTATTHPHRADPDAASLQLAQGAPEQCCLLHVSSCRPARSTPFSPLLAERWTPHSGRSSPRPGHPTS